MGKYMKKVCEISRGEISIARNELPWQRVNFFVDSFHSNEWVKQKNKSEVFVVCTKQIGLKNKKIEQDFYKQSLQWSEKWIFSLGFT